jgi:hypothetical protein
MQGRVIILVHCTPPQWGLSTYEVSSWYLKYFLRYAPDKNVGRKDGRKEGWSDRRTETISIFPAAFSAGDNNVDIHILIWWLTTDEVHLDDTSQHLTSCDTTEYSLLNSAYWYLIGGPGPSSRATIINNAGTFNFSKCIFCKTKILPV